MQRQEHPEFDVFIGEMKKEMTIKAGQKCTAVRRIMVPEQFIDDVQTAISKSLKGISMEIRMEGVKNGRLAGNLKFKVKQK